MKREDSVRRHLLWEVSGAPRPDRCANASSADALAVGGYEPFSTRDWPGRLASVVFVQGCPWRCSYCHNPELQRHIEGSRSWAEIRAHWRSRLGLIDAVVFSGGEPTLAPALAAALGEVRDAGLAVGVHTAGVSARHLKALLPRLDWVALDVKSPPRTLVRLTGAPGSEREALQSLHLVLASGRDHELRTSWHPKWMSEAALLDLATWLSTQGVRRWVVQQVAPPGERVGAALTLPWREALRSRVPEVSFR